MDLSLSMIDRMGSLCRLARTSDVSCRRCFGSFSIFRSPKIFADATWVSLRARFWRSIFSLLLCFFAVPVRGFAEDVPTKDTPGRGSLVIIGGSERFSHHEYWDEIVELAGGPGSRIAVFPTA